MDSLPINNSISQRGVINFTGDKQKLNFMSYWEVCYIKNVFCIHFKNNSNLIRNAITSARLKPEYTSDDYVFTMIIIKNPKKEAKTIWKHWSYKN